MPDPVDLGFAVKLPPREAIKYFQAKGYEISWNWWEVWQQSHAKAFTVAKAIRADVLQSIRDEVEKALVNGTTQRQFSKNLTPVLQRLGWWGKQIATDTDGIEREVTLGTPRRLKNIYRTNLQTAYMTGRYNAQIENAQNRPYWQYVAVLDSRTRPSHEALNGHVFRFDDPIWNTHYPPNGWGCRCRVRALSERRLKSLNKVVETSANRLTDFAINVGTNRNTGEVVSKQVTGFEYANGKFFKPDAGWSYNPGKAAYTPDNQRWVPAVANQYEKAVGVSSATGLFKRLELKKLDDFIETGTEISKTIDDLATATSQSFQTALMKTLQQSRPMSTPANVVNGGAGANIIKQASQRYPDDWTKYADDFGSLNVKARKNARSWAATMPDFGPGETRRRIPNFGVINAKSNEGFILIRTGAMDAAVHEYGHRLQSAMPQLDALFTELHKRRTAGDKLKRLRDWFPGMNFNEVTREDNYFHPYQGKEYDGEPKEMLTMSFQWVLASSEVEFEKFRKHDPEMLNLVLGLLFNFKP